MTSTSPYSTSPGSSARGPVHLSPVQTAFSSSAPSAQSGIGAAPTASASAPGKPKNKPRKRVNTAEKRNQHNAIERQRRETLNSKFFSLARLLPSLAAHRRPSKSAIVNGSIAHLTHQRNQRLLAAKLLRQLCAERDALAKECNEWRFANGLAPTGAGAAASAWTDEMDEVCDVENETFGTFANCDNVDEDGDELDDGPNEMSLEQAAAVAASFNVNVHPNGLYTPRSSTDAGLGLGVLGPNGFGPGMQQWMQQQQQQQQQHDARAGMQQQQQQAQASMPTSGAQPGSMRSSSASLPFNAFMSESDSPANSASGYSNGNGMPTPPTTGDYSAHVAAGQFANAGVQMQHTPSPRSSHSHPNTQEDKGPTSHAWTEQQLLFLRAIQQQQQQQQQQRMQMAPTSSPAQMAPFNPALLANAFAQQPSNPGGPLSDPADAFDFFASAFPQHAGLAGSGNGGSMTMGGMPQSNALHMHHADFAPAVPAPPPLQRAHTDSLEAWRRGTAGQPSVADLKMAFRAGMGMGMAWEQGPRPTVEGF